MIIGVGTDIVQINRIENILKKYGNCFYKKILSNSEQEKVNNLKEEKKASFLAKRFAAKEAISKAFGTGISDNLLFKNISITNNDLGKPIAKIDANDAKYYEQFKIDISISDDYPIVIAFAVVTSSDKV